MQLCDKLCKKIFHSSFGRSDYEEHTEIQNVQLISTTKTNIDTVDLKAPSVILIEPTPNQSPSKSKSPNDEVSVSLDPNVAQSSTETQDLSDIVLDIEDQHTDEIAEEEAKPDADLAMMELENECVLSMLDKSTEGEEEVFLDNDLIQCEVIEKSGDDDDLDDGPEDDNEDNYGYEDMDDNSKRLATKYGDLGGELLLLNLPNPRLSNCSLGFKLSGHKDLNTMGVFICHIVQNSLVDIDGRLNVGDEILEVDDHILFGRSHVNVTPIIRACNQRVIKLVIHRSPDWVTKMAIPVAYRCMEDGASTASSRRGSIQDLLYEKDYNQLRKTSTVSLSQIANGSPSISTIESHTIYLNKSAQGFGFAIMERSFTNEDGIFIKHIAPAGPAAQDGSLRPGDKLININNQDITSASYETALELLKGCKNKVHLVVTRIRCAHSPTHVPSSPLKSIYQKRLSAPHITALPVLSRAISPTIFEEKVDVPSSGISIKMIPESESGLTTLVKSMADLNARRRSSLSNLSNIDVVAMLMNQITDDDNVEVVSFDRNKQALGMSVIGGSDTFIGDVIVHDIFSNGMIATDGRVKVGDRILMINDTSVMDQSHEEVLNLLQSSCPQITLKIRHPDSPILDQDIYEVVTTVELVKRPSKGLGISITGREGAKGVYICDVVKAGVADADGRLQPGDQILEINGEDFRNSSQEETATTLKFIMGTVTFKIGRIQKMNLHYTPTYLMVNEDHADHSKSPGGKHLVPGQSPSRLSAASPAHAR